MLSKPKQTRKVIGFKNNNSINEKTFDPNFFQRQIIQIQQTLENMQKNEISKLLDHT